MWGLWTNSPPNTVHGMPVILIEHASTHTSGILLRSLVDHGLRVQTVRIAAEETLPNDLAEVDGVLSLGGPQSITDDPPSWVDTETTFLREAGDARIPILGIGLGANLLAKAHGATIETAPCTDAGFHRVDLDPAGREDPLFRGLPWFGSWPVWSRDRIAGLPDGGRKLASRDGSAIDGFACGIFSYGIAFEADWSSTTLSERMQDAADPVASSIADAQTLVATVQDSAESIQRQARRFAENVSSYLMPIERVNAGVAKDIHH